MAYPRKIPLELEKIAIEKAITERASATDIAKWLESEHGIKVSGSGVQKMLDKTRAARETMAKQIVRGKITYYLLSDLDLLQEIKAVETERFYQAEAEGDVEGSRAAQDRLLKITKLRLQYSGVGQPDRAEDQEGIDALRESVAKMLQAQGMAVIVSETRTTPADEEPVNRGGASSESGGLSIKGES